MPRICQLALRSARFAAICVATVRAKAHIAAVIPESPLDDPHLAAFAWARYKRLMRWMVVVTVVVIAIAVAMLYLKNGFVSIHFYIATVLGIGTTMLLTSALMGLVFLSSGTGHDDAISDPLEEERNR